MVTNSHNPFTNIAETWQNHKADYKLSSANVFCMPSSLSHLCVMISCCVNFRDNNTCVYVNLHTFQFVYLIIDILSNAMSVLLHFYGLSFYEHSGIFLCLYVFREIIKIELLLKFLSLLIPFRQIFILTWKETEVEQIRWRFHEKFCTYLCKLRTLIWSVIGFCARKIFFMMWIVSRFEAIQISNVYEIIKLFRKNEWK